MDDAHCLYRLQMVAGSAQYGFWQPIKEDDMGKTSQRKGRGGELELARILQGYGYNVQPGQAVSFGDTPDLTGLPGVHIECKRAEALRLPEWMDQARRDADKFRDGLPAVFWRKNHCPWLVIMPLDSWISMYKWPEMDENGPRKGVKY